MIKCANCSLAAVYTIDEPGANPVDYCSTCLPRWLLTDAADGKFALRSEGATKEVTEEKPKTIKKKAADPVEETPADESN
jgi:hypothetical protein